MNLTTLLAVYDKDDKLLQRFEYADGRMPLSFTDNSGDRFYISYNQIGSPRAITDENGNILKTLTYDSFGTIIADSNPTFKIPFGFAGGLYDADSKLTRFGYRDYDASTGKWIAKDPIGFDGGDTNLYGYMLGDPVGFVDPSGLIFDDANSSIDVITGFMNPFPLGKVKTVIGLGNKSNKTKSKDLFKDEAIKFSSEEACRKCLATGLPAEACQVSCGKINEPKEPKTCPTE